MTRQRIIGLVAVLGLLAAGLLTHGFGLFAKTDTELKLYGNVDIRQVELGFRVGGRISSMAFDEGARVPADAVLARLDARPLSDTLAATQAQIALADADLARSRNGNRSQDIARATEAVAEQRALYDKARTDFERRSALVASGAVSQALVAASRADFQASRARLRSAEDALSLQRAGSRREDVAAAAARRQAALAQANRARTDIADTALFAPESGIVLTRAREPGAIVQPGETVYTLTVDRPMRLRAYVAQTALSRIGPGMMVLVKADGNPKTYHGNIGFISSTAEFTPKSVQTESLRADLVYRLRINVSDPDDALRQGQPVTISVPAARPAAR
ncbi:MAG: HlyD family efflux transporter periplasmic adaptor subunit [Novosphingobium sp.]